jgi:hypothetical protein
MCSKRGYRRRKDAKRALKRIQSFQGHGDVPRLYLCECGKWHLTKQVRA